MSDISTQWLFFLLSISAKALGLVLVAALTLGLFRLRDPNVRHRVWTGVLAGMLSLPALALILPSITLPIPMHWSGDSSVGNEFVAAVGPAGQVNALDGIAVSEEPPTGRVTPLRAAAAGSPEPRSIPREIATNPERLTQAADSLSPARPASTPMAWSIGEFAQASSTVLVAVWIAVAIVLTLRLAVGLWLSRRLLRQANVADAKRLDSCLAELPPAVARQPVDVRESAEVVVPATVGWLRPIVVLPTGWRKWTDQKLIAVLAHELTHVARRDFFVSLAAEVNRCVYWFHPVSWWLRSRLSDLAEAACDDAVIGYTGDATGYARHLLEVATSLASGSRRRVEFSLAMARESNVEGRIMMILDSNRRLSRRLGWQGATAISAIALLTIATAAALRPATALEPIEPANTKQTDAIEGTSTDVVRIHGRVTDRNGSGVPKVRLGLYRMSRSQWYAAADESTLISEIKVDRDGNFDTSVQQALLPRTDKYGNWIVLVASAPDFARTVLTGNPGIPIVDGKRIEKPDFLKERVEVTLQPDVTIRGRVLSIEGQPVEGAAVSVYQLTRADPTRLAKWLAEASKTPPQDAGQMRRLASLGGPPAEGMLFPHHGYLHLPIESTKAVYTDEQGVFELTGLASEDDLVVLRIRGEGITDTTVHVLGRDMPVVYARHATRISRYGAYYGRNFDFVAQPSVPVFGIVRDIETKEPLRNIPVAVGGVYGVTMSHTGYMVTRTDDDGRYRIEGLPIPPQGTRKWDRNTLSIRPGKLPYIENDNIPVPAGDGVNPVEFNVELRRAVLARGRITSKTTGEPVAAEMHYAPFQTNEHNDSYRRYRDDLTTFIGNDSRYRTDEDGYFEIPVIPGRGVLAAKCPDGGYITAFGAQEIPEYQNKEGSTLGRITSDHIVPALFHSLKSIDVPADVKQFDVDLQVNLGSSITVRFVGPEGQPLHGVGGRGLGSNRQWKVIEDDHAEAENLAIDQVRAMFFRHDETNLQRLVRLTPEEGQTDFTVRLLPPSKLVGRLVDPESRPLSKVTIEARHRNDPDMMNSLQQIRTDEEGRFEYVLPVGASYTVIGQTDKYFQVVKDLENESPKNIDLGDLVVDPDEERWAPVKPKREPVVTDLVTTNSDTASLAGTAVPEN